MGDLISFPEIKTIAEWRTFSEKQFITIQFLQEANKHLEAEIAKLKTFIPSPGQGAISNVIVSPEQGLIDDQIGMIQQRAYSKELNLEDIKKLDILLRHSRLLKQDAKILDGKPKVVTLSNEELVRIAQGSNVAQDSDEST